MFTKLPALLLLGVLGTASTVTILQVSAPQHQQAQDAPAAATAPVADGPVVPVAATAPVKEFLQPGGVPLSCCGGSPIPTTLRLTGNDGKYNFAGTPLTYYSTNPVSGHLTYYGFVPNVGNVNGLPVNAYVTFLVGVESFGVPNSVPVVDLKITYNLWPGPGTSAGLLDCGTMSFTTKALGPFSPYNLPAGITVSP